MKTVNFPYIASILGIVIMLLVMKGSQPGADGSTAIPLLTLLVMSEFAFFVTAFGVFIGVKHLRVTGMQPLYAAVTVFCALLSMRFAWLGFELWPL